MSSSTIELMNKGILCLRRELGDIGCEEFISVIMRERFDYTEWRKNNLFLGMSVNDINLAAAAFEQEHPFKGKAKRI